MDKVSSSTETMEKVSSSAEIMEKVSSSTETKKYDIMWASSIYLAVVHLAGVYGFYLFCTKAMWLTNLYTFFLVFLTSLGITAGAHRLWSHKSYKARLPLQILLVFFNTIGAQLAIVDWVRFHRMHHKYSDTNADPHNVNRGFFFAHIGWLMIRRHPDYQAKINTVDMSDILNDPVLRFQKRYFKILALLACVVLPTYIATLWGESLWNAYFVCAMFRYAYALNLTFLVNSGGHMWGTRPYDKSINPVESKILSHLTFGEAFHNYHHTFPNDYKTAELGTSFNWIAMFIDLMAAIGWAYDLKTVSTDVVQRRIVRTGDGSHSISGN